MSKGLAQFAKKSLGQNFLKSEKALSQIIEAGDIQEGDLIVEIGPGEGALTSKILEKIKSANLAANKGDETEIKDASSLKARLVVIEKDDRLIPILEEKFKEYLRTSESEMSKQESDSGSKETHSSPLTIIHGDIIDLLEDEDFIKKISGTDAKQTYKVIANIPYYITGLILRKMFEQKNLPAKAVLLVQREVADRIVAGGENGKISTSEDRNGAKESLLSLSIKIYGTPKRVAVVPRGAFVPAPTVDSAIISIENIARKIDASKEPAFFELLHAAFSHKRKRLAKNLMSLIEDKETVSASTEWKFSSSLEVENVLISLNLDINIRAEDLSVEKYIQLLDRLI